MKKTRLGFFIILFVVLIALTGSASAIPGRTYTVDADFDEGVLFSVEHETVHDQLQLSSQTTTFPFIWVPNTGQGTVSKVNTETGKEIGRYRVAPRTDSSPSRTTVDLQGNCYVGNRQAGTVVKIGLYEAGACIDRNSNGVCDTSKDLDNDGVISAAELLPWGQDECVLYEVVLIAGSEGVYVPGTFPGPYDTNYWGTSPRGLAVDSSNNVWAGTWSTQKFYYLNGATGAIIKSVSIAPYSAGQGSYGAVIDRNGVLWSSTLYGPVVRVDPSVNPPTVSSLPVGHQTYGLGLDNLDQLFVTGWTDSKLSRINVNTGTKDWTKAGPYAARGAASTADNNIWVASTDGNSVVRYTNDGNNVATVGGFNGPTGVAVDAAGKVWATDLNDDNIKRINPATNTIDLTKNIPGAGGHYTYSDMTGIVVRSITTKIGTWTVVYDSGAAGTPWGTVSWDADTISGSSSVTVRARSSNDALSWSPWEDAANGVLLSATPAGRYIQVESTLQITSGTTSPILYDLTVKARDFNSPEFPSALIPVSALIGMLCVVFLARMKNN